LLATVVVLALTDAACGGGGGTDCTSENAPKLTGTLTVKGPAQPEEDSEPEDATGSGWRTPRKERCLEARS